MKPSPYWRGLLWRRNLLNLGIDWKIGDGIQILIRKDNWLPRNIVFKLFNPHNISDHLIHVGDLINEDTNTWNISLINQFFSPVDANRIMQLPLAPIPCKD